MNGWSGERIYRTSAHVTLALQNLMGFDVAFGRARGTGEPGVYCVVIAYQEEEPARAAFATALRLTLAAMHDEPFDFADPRARPGDSTARQRQPVDRRHRHRCDG